MSASKWSNDHSDRSFDSNQVDRTLMRDLFIAPIRRADHHSSNEFGNVAGPRHYPTSLRQETLSVAMLLAFAGGYIDAYTWITHHVFANAQIRQHDILVDSCDGGRWSKAFRYVPSLVAFTVGVIMATWLRHFAGERPETSVYRRNSDASALSASCTIGSRHRGNAGDFLCRCDAGCKFSPRSRR